MKAVRLLALCTVLVRAAFSAARAAERTKMFEETRQKPAWLR
jgi:hypothetical protein